MVMLLHDYREQPVQLFDGLEPATLTFRPASFGLSEYEPVDLVAACSTRPEDTLAAELQRTIHSLAPPRVRAFNKSAARWESLLGYYAIAESSARAERLVILFSFDEVSPSRCVAYLHALLRIS
jgi:hypothetical protein